MPFGLDDAAFGAIASGVVQGGAGLLGGLFGASGQASTNAQSIANAQQMQSEAERWQTEMSSTAYQRTMSDMRAAGLNPILAASLGPTAWGAAGGSPPSLGNPGAAMQSGIMAAGSAVGQAAQTKAVLTQAEKDQSQVDVNKSTSGLNDAQTGYTKSNTELNQKLGVKTEQETETSKANAAAASAAAARDSTAANNNSITSQILQHNVNSAKAEADLKRLEADAAAKYGPGAWGHVLTTIDRTVSGAGGLPKGPADPVLGERPFGVRIGDWLRGKK